MHSWPGFLARLVELHCNRKSYGHYIGRGQHINEMYCRAVHDARASLSSAGKCIIRPCRHSISPSFGKNTSPTNSTKDTEATLATMTDDAYVNHVPVMTGGYGKAALRHFYSRDFIPSMPPDTTITAVSRTVGENQLVDEMIFSF